MPNLHDIERRINSVSSTKQITRTMEMVAAAKIRRSAERVDAATPYSESMEEMLGNVAARVDGSANPLLQKHEEVKNLLVIAVVSDRGLAGGFNSNVLRHVEKLIHAKAAQGIQSKVIACGKKAVTYFNFRQIPLELEFRDLSADPTVDEAQTISMHAIEGYLADEFDQVIVVYNHAKNAAEQILREETLLPVDASAVATEEDYSDVEDKGMQENGPEAVDASGDVIFEPSVEGVLERLLPAYIKTMVYHALVDSAAGEQGARRTAMQSATDNANEMVETLQRVYNRVRQGAITTEINEIVGGAAALED